MNIDEKAYTAIRLSGDGNRPDIVLFAAPASDVANWAGVPQKALLDGTETVGWQRTDDPRRVQKLSQFFADSRNSLQNPLLLASQGSSSRVRWDDEGGGRLIVQIEDLAEESIVVLLRRVRLGLESRMPALAERDPPERLVSTVKARLADFNSSASDDGYEEPQDIGSSDDATSSALADDSHIVEFWESVAARHEVATEMEAGGVDLADRDDIAGFTRTALVSLLKPVVVVDGQHRLLGALGVPDWVLENDEEVRKEMAVRFAAGESDDAIRADIAERFDREVPLALLLSESPAEQVFQFVVVNQKATPIAPALLSTIVSSTLTTEEMNPLRERLSDSGISLDDARAAGRLVRDPACPFYKRVQLGFDESKSDKLHWGVWQSLVAVFREFRGGVLMHETQRADYADRWSKRFLESCPLVASWEDQEFESAESYWSDPAVGPWRDVFNSFWEGVVAEFGTVDDEDAYNYWGNPRNSQLFNKPSLLILGADFFKWMFISRTQIDDVPSVKSVLVPEWLEDVDRSYFSRDWKLIGSGVKKDNPGISRRWSELWVQYRETPGRLPTYSQYTKALGV